MASCTPSRSVLLSQLLDDVVGTEEMVKIRQDFCRIWDCITSNRTPNHDNCFFTGSKAEGLDIPSSDYDYMIDINNHAKVLIIQKLQDAPITVHRNVFYMKTENVPPCFVMLRSVNQVQSDMLFEACQSIDNLMYLSSYLLVNNFESESNKIPFYRKIARQGPSVEQWTPYMNASQSGIDSVLSIHCPFWPATASEWILRQRRFAWPSPHDIKSIGDFGFHLVPVGHPHSDRNMMEWRISFSVAERTLVWSFNHVQIQCYAVMKIILKEFINPHCSLDNRVLCSYFIKTFLFWKYEETDPSFWSEENIGVCIMFLLSGFRECILRSSLKHYFIPEFNLLSVKLTTDAREEILRILDILLKSDISIIKECNTLKPVWDKFVNHNESGIREFALRGQGNLLKTDLCLMRNILKLQHALLNISQSDLVSLVYRFVSRGFQNVQITCLLSFVVQTILFLMSRSVVGNYMSQNGNKRMYRSCYYLRLNTGRFDVSTFRLWYSMLMTKRSDYRLSLDVLNTMLSSIPPFALYCSPSCDLRASNETKKWYVDAFSRDDKNLATRARQAWMFDIVFMPSDIDMVPVAIQIELTHCDHLLGVYLSPFVFTYYLMFLNYHALHQYENRDCALRQLIEAVNNPEQCGDCRWHSYNIAGHCLWSMGLYEQARDMFIQSYLFTSSIPHHRFNSARLYLQCLPL